MRRALAGEHFAACGQNPTPVTGFPVSPPSLLVSRLFRGEELHRAATTSAFGDGAFGAAPAFFSFLFSFGLGGGEYYRNSGGHQHDAKKAEAEQFAK